MTRHLFTVGDRVKLHVKRHALEVGTLGTVRSAFESVPGYLILFDGETSERFAWQNTLEQSDDEADTER